MKYAVCAFWVGWTMKTEVIINPQVMKLLLEGRAVFSF